MAICYHSAMGDRKISNNTAAMMITIAFMLDCLNIAVDFLTFGIGGFFMDAIITIVFTIWFSHLGASLFSSRNTLRTLGAILMDAFPFTDLAFPWTLQVAYTALTERHHASPTAEGAKKALTRSGWRI